MGKGILKKKRTRLIALLAALCAFLAVGGIGVGSAFAAMAATRNGQSSAARIFHPKVRTISPENISGTVLASDDPCTTTYTPNSGYGSCIDYGTYANFNSSAQVFNNVQSGQIYGGWAGQTFTASVDLGAGVSMPITAPIGLWNGNAFSNPNSLTPGEIEEAMLNGDYMGAIAVSPVYSSQKFTPSWEE